MGQVTCIIPTWKMEGFRKMSVKCLAEDYVIVEKEDKSYVYNSLYEDSEKGLLLAAFLELHEIRGDVQDGK